MFFVDDLFTRAVGLSIPPFDMIWIIEQIQDTVLREQYDPEKIKDQIKENRLLFELGEISKEEYDENNNRLNHQLKIGNNIDNMNIHQRVDILG